VIFEVIDQLANSIGLNSSLSANTSPISKFSVSYGILNFSTVFTTSTSTTKTTTTTTTTTTSTNVSYPEPDHFNSHISPISRISI
jgi:hypothetical protein